MLPFLAGCFAMWFCDCVLIECVGLRVGAVLLGSVAILLSWGWRLCWWLADCGLVVRLWCLRSVVISRCVFLGFGSIARVGLLFGDGFELITLV